MNCPFCQGPDTQVRDSRPIDGAIRRRRICPACKGRFTTYERAQFRELSVLKRSGRRQPFDRDKLSRSLMLALAGHPLTKLGAEPDLLLSRIVRRLESLGETEVTTTQIGDVVMQALRQADTVAYVRYASVYRDFKSAADFAAFMREEALT